MSELNTVLRGAGLDVICKNIHNLLIKTKQNKKPPANFMRETYNARANR